jgi:hypothetical protein
MARRKLSSDMAEGQDTPQTSDLASTRSDPTDTSPPDGAHDRFSAPGFLLDPQRLLRIAGVTREVLEEARRIKHDAGAVAHLRRVHEQITKELREALPPELYEELDELTPDIRDGTLEELALAHAEILGWLEGLFQGTQLAIQAQAAQALDRMRRPLSPGPADEKDEDADKRDSRYL